MIYLDKNKRQKQSLESQENGFPEAYFRVEFSVIPSWNDYLATSRHFGAAQGFFKKWRAKGFGQAIAAARFQLFPTYTWTEFDVAKNGRTLQTVHTTIKPCIFEACKITLRIWRPNFGRYDLFNPFVKPIVDGFVDAGVMPDDNCYCVRGFEVEFCGVDDSLKLSKEARENRKVKRITSKARMPLPARYRFDFYKV